MDATQQLIWEPEEQDEEQGGSDREPRGRLRIFAGSQRAETEFLVYSGANVIGRHESCHICIPVQSVSKKHAVIEIEGDSHLIHDCKSLNSTRRKNTVLKPFVRYQICDGDLFLFGDVACQYVMLPPAAQVLDSDSETDSESMLPQTRPCDRWDPAPEAAGSGLESADDSLVLPPTQPYGRKLAMRVVRSDVYVKESEDDDTPWKEARSVSSRIAQEPNASVHQTPSPNVVPESDDDAENTPHSSVRPSQLHYDSDTDLEDDQRSGEEQAEHSSKQPANEISPPSVAGQGSVPVTSDATLNNLSAADEMAGSEPGKAVDRGAGVDSPQRLITSPSADVRPRVNASRGELQEDIVADSVFSRASHTREVARAAISPEEQVERHEADYSASTSPRVQGETEETLDNVEAVDGAEVEIDDDTSEFYALQPTQCFVLMVPSTQDETPEKENPVTDDNPATAEDNPEEEGTQLFTSQSPTFSKDHARSANAEEEATQVYACDYPSFNQEPQSDNPATAEDSPEEEGTQLFTSQSPTFSKDHTRNNPATAEDDTEEEGTQLFISQSPTFSKDHARNNPAAAEDNTEEEGTQLFPFEPPTSSKEHARNKPATAEDNPEEEGTQLFTSQSPTFSKDHARNNPTTVEDNTEEEGTQLFPFQFPTSSKDHARNNPATAEDNTEEEGTQLFTFQSPTSSKNHARNNPAAAEDNTEEEGTQLFPFQPPTSSKDHARNNPTTVEDDTEEEGTQLFPFQSPTSSKDHARNNLTTAEDNTEEEGTQLFTFQSPNFSKDHARNNPATAEDNTEEEGTQLFTFPSLTSSKNHARSDPVAVQSLEEESSLHSPPFSLQPPVFSKEPLQSSASDRGTDLVQGEGGRGAASGSEQPQEESDTVLLVTEAECPPGPQGQEREEPEEEERWATEETQQFLTHERAVEEEEPEKSLSLPEERLPTSCAGDRPTLGQADGPPGPGTGAGVEPAGSGQADGPPRPGTGADVEPAGSGQADGPPGPGTGAGVEPAGSGQADGPPGPGTGADVEPAGSGQAEPGRREEEEPLGRQGEAASGRPEESGQAAAAAGQEGGRRSRAQPRATVCKAGGGRRKKQPVPSEQSSENQEMVENGPQPSTEEPAATPARPRRGRGKQEASSRSTTGKQPDESPCSPPQRKSRRRSVAEPREVTQQTESPPELQHTARGKRTRRSQATSQQTEMPSGRSRRSRTASRIDSEKETSTPPQTKAHQQTSQLSPSASVATIAENVALRKRSQATSQQTEMPSGRSRRSRTASRIDSEKETSTPPQTKAHQQTSQLSPSASVATIAENVALRKRSQATSQQTEMPAGRSRRSRTASRIDSEKETSTPPQTKAHQQTSQLSPSASVATIAENVALRKRSQASSQQTESPSGHWQRSRAAGQVDGEKEASTPQQVRTLRQRSQLSPSASLASIAENIALPKVMFTGLVDEVGMKVITRLGGEVVDCVHNSTHLVTDRICRTVKFLCAVARGIPVVTPDWLKKSGMNSYFLSPRSFLLEDRDQEQNFNFKLKDSLRKARERPLLQEYQIHVTAGVQPSPKQMAAILQCSGATVLPKMPRAYKEKVLVISCPADLPKCRAAGDAGIPVVNAEFILTGILQQTVDLAKYRLDEGDVVDGKPEERGRKRSSTVDSKPEERGRKRSSTVDSKPEERGSKPGPTAAAPTRPAAAKRRKKR